jgi:hypothetical protein
MTSASSLGPAERRVAAPVRAAPHGAGATLLVDAHVHIHPSFDLARFFSAAARNLRSAAARLGSEEGRWRGALLLAESGPARVFERLASGALFPSDGIRIDPMQDEAALRVRVPGAEPFYLIAGRQIATTSGVEVLSLGTREIVPDRLTFEEAMERSCALEAVTAIPWGFGKWSLARGELVRDQLTRREAGSIALGDNGGRLRGAPTPQLFQLAEELGFAVLPGSDPFPVPSQAERVGSYGFVMGDWHEPDEAPARTLVGRLRGLRVSPPRFGHLTGLARFAVAQLRMQLHNRLRAASA